MPSTPLRVHACVLRFCTFFRFILHREDISSIEATYKGGDASSFVPCMSLKVILYAYLQKIHADFRKYRLADVIDDIFT